MTDFVTGMGEEGHGYDDIASGEDLLNWVKDSLVPEIFGDKKCAPLPDRYRF